MRSLSCRQILKLYEVWEAEKSYYFVMEYCQGGVLTEKLSQARKFEQSQKIQSMRDIPFSNEDKRIYLKQLLRALSHMQKVGIMHRDIKPDNIMLRNRTKPELVLTDFGLSTFEKEPKYLYPKCGTPGYVAPEIINKKQTDADLETWHYTSICDIFSLGATFYFMLTLKQLFFSVKTKETIDLNKACKIDYNSAEMEKIDPIGN